MTVWNFWDIVYVASSWISVVSVALEQSQVFNIYLLHSSPSPVVIMFNCTKHIYLGRIDFIVQGIAVYFTPLKWKSTCMIIASVMETNLVWIWLVTEIQHWTWICLINLIGNIYNEDMLSKICSVSSCIWKSSKWLVGRIYDVKHLSDYLMFYIKVKHWWDLYLSL